MGRTLFICDPNINSVCGRAELCRAYGYAECHMTAYKQFAVLNDKGEPIRSIDYEVEAVKDAYRSGYKDGEENGGKDRISDAREISEEV